MTLLADPTLDAVRNALASSPKTALNDSSLTPAAVLLLLYPKAGDYSILLNKRSNSVDEHKGEIALPGGRWDEGDTDLLDTALRETHEEMGVRPSDVEVLGGLGDFATISNYAVSTFVGTIPAPYAFFPNEEVAEVIEAPVSYLLDTRGWRDDAWMEEGRVHRRPAFGYEGHLVYGATGVILGRFLDIAASAWNKESEWTRRRS